MRIENFMLAFIFMMAATVALGGIYYFAVIHPKKRKAKSGNR